MAITLDETKGTVLQVLPSLVTGGVERGTVEMAQALQQAKWRAIVASAGGPLVYNLNRIGARHVTLPLASKNPFIIWQNIEKLIEVIEAFDVKIVHARSRAPAWSAYFAAKRTGVHFVTTFHSAYGAETRLKRLYNSVMAKGERIIAISKFVEAYAAKTYNIPQEKLRLIPRGVDTDRFEPTSVDAERIEKLEQEWKIEPGKTVIMMPGRLSRWKGQLVFIEAVAKLNRDDLICLIVGSGPDDYRYELEDAIIRHNLGDKVKLVDECRDMPAAFKIAKIVVSASTRPEGFGRVIVEAQAMGCLVIATEHGGAEETIVNGETGWLVPPGDAAKLAEALTNALNMSEGEREQIGKRAINHVRSEFTTAMMADRTIAVYDELLSTDQPSIAEKLAQGTEPKEKAKPESPIDIFVRALLHKKPPGQDKNPHLLVIRFGALGDLIMCRQAFHEIRQSNPDAKITLLTEPAFEKFARTMPWFDDVIAAKRAPAWQIDEWLNLLGQLYRFAPRRVYDLQGKFRQSVLFYLLGGPFWGPEWSGAAPLCSHPRVWPPAPDMHFVDFLAAQLRKAGIPKDNFDADITWLSVSLGDFDLPKKFALLIPGSSPQLLHKRWPARHYAELANRLKERGIGSVVIGTADEADSIAAIRKDAPHVIDLSGKTNLYQIAELARRAAFTVGNDTGPMHMAAAVECPTLAILSSHTNPVWSAPYGPKTAWVKSERIGDVSVDEVLLALDKLTASPSSQA